MHLTFATFVYDSRTVCACDVDFSHCLKLVYIKCAVYFVDGDVVVAFAGELKTSAAVGDLNLLCVTVIFEPSNF